MFRYVIATISVGMLVLSGCGSSSEVKPSSATASSANPSVTPTAAPSTAPSYKKLDKQGFEDALLNVQDMPDGYSQDPPAAPNADKNFCDYKIPHRQKLTVSRDFTKGAGASAEFVSTGFRDYGSDAAAKESFDALVTTMQTCRTDTYQGEKLTYSVIKVPKLGEGSIGVRIDSDSSTILQNFAVAGPTLVNTGIGGITSADSDLAITLFKAQVAKYASAAAE